MAGTLMCRVANVRSDIKLSSREAPRGRLIQVTPYK